MSTLSPAPAATSDARRADPLTPLESALTNASHLLESAHLKTPCFDTLAPLSPVTPLDSALTKNTRGGGPLAPGVPNRNSVFALCDGTVSRLRRGLSGEPLLDVR